LRLRPSRSPDIRWSRYGAGVYALYYNGTFDAYAPLSRTEQPIYVGKAHPKDVAAKDGVGQGKASSIGSTSTDVASPERRRRRTRTTLSAGS
jgi:hypothetical protein